MTDTPADASLARRNGLTRFFAAGPAKPGDAYGAPGQGRSAAISVATSLALAGGTVPTDRPVDGVDLTPVLLGEGSSPREVMAYYRMGELYAFRKGRYKAHFLTEGRYGLPPPRTAHDPPILFDLEEDPAERYDVSAERPEALAMVLAASAMFVVESEAQPEAFSSIPAAMWWAVATLTTVGYGDVTPITPLGKLVASCITIIGVGMVALPTSILATGFSELHQRSRRALESEARSALDDGILTRDESLAYADLAGLPPFIGLFAARFTFGSRW